VRLTPIRHRPDPKVVVVTGARASRHVDIEDRRRKYLITMAVRTVAFVGAVCLFVAGLEWEAALLLVLSLVAPIIGVVIANNHVRSAAGRPEVYDPDDTGNVPSIGRGPTIDG